MTVERQQRRRQGRYYTPRPVVEWCWRVLRWWIPAAELRNYRVVDPAVGDGVFLHTACQEGWIDASQVLGIDLFPPEGANAPFLRFKGDGLVNHPIVGFVSEGFDLVIGNPPYGDTLMREWSLTGDDKNHLQTIGEYLSRYHVGIDKAPVIAPDELLGWLSSPVGRRYIQRMIRCPVEVLFLQRFLDLCRPGGWCAVVLPDGILANARMGWLRRLVEEKAELKAIVALPGNTFQSEGTMANTSLIFLKRRRGIGDRVYLAAPDFFGSMGESAEYLEGAAGDLLSGIEESTGVWLAPEKLQGERWDPGFWNPRYRRTELEMGDSVPLGDYVEKLTYGPIRPGERPVLDPNGVLVIGQSQFTEAGLDLSKAIRVVPGSIFDPPRSQVFRGDLLFPRSGVGSLLRFKAGVYMEDQPANLSCFVDLLRLREMNPFYLWLTFKTRFVRDQIMRLKNGVGTPNLNFSEIRGLKIPWCALEQQNIWEERYCLEVAPLQRRRVEVFDEEARNHWGGLADQRFAELARDMEQFLKLKR